MVDMQGKKRATNMGPMAPRYSDKANGIQPKKLPQVWVEPWMWERMEVAVMQRAAKSKLRFCRSHWIREAIEEKMDRELGKP